MAPISAARIKNEEIFTSALRQLSIVALILIIIYICVNVLFWYLKKPINAEVSVQFVKLFSLFWMNIHTERTVDGAIVEGNNSLKQFLGYVYTTIRVYVWIAVFILLISIFVSINPLGIIEYLRSNITVELPFFIGSNRYLSTYLPNLLVLAPIFAYTFVNHHCINHDATPRNVRIHLQYFLFFVDLPLCASILAFFAVALSVLHWDDPGQESLFVGGAAALLIFVSSSMTICVDEHAKATLYRASVSGNQERWWSYGVVGIAWLGAGVLIGLDPVSLSTIRVTPAIAGWALLVAGAFQFIHGFVPIGWREFLLSVFVGLFYGLAGFIILYSTEGASALNFGLAGMIFITSALRFILAYRFWKAWGWVLAVSAGFGTLNGILILAAVWGLPIRHEMFWYFLAIDLLVHGMWWILFSREKRAQPGAVTLWHPLT
jgi:uncharacterized membrane protein HdeD (DUF308 family)